MGARNRPLFTSAPGAWLAAAFALVGASAACRNPVAEERERLRERVRDYVQQQVDGELSPRNGTKTAKAPQRDEKQAETNPAQPSEPSQPAPSSTPPALPDGWDVSWVPAAVRRADGTPGRLSEMVVYGSRRSLDWTVPARVVVKLQLPESPIDFDQLTFTERKETQRDPVKFPRGRHANDLGRARSRLHDPPADRRRRARARRGTERIRLPRPVRAAHPVLL